MDSVSKSDGESYLPSGCTGSQLVLRELAVATPQLYSKLMYVYGLKFKSEADLNKNTLDTRK